MADIQFFNIKDSIYAEKANGTNVNYFIFPEFEIHLNVVKPHSVQEWHYHSIVDENILVTRGKLLCRYLKNGEEQLRYVNKNEVIRVLNSVHTFENDTDEDVEFVVFRFIPKGTDDREQIKNDKTIVRRER